jgi:hypothetical protein
MRALIRISHQRPILAGGLRYGGLPLYRAALPFFLGLIIGHFSLAGIFWPLFSLLISPEASAAYHLYFG